MGEHEPRPDNSSTGTFEKIAGLPVEALEGARRGFVKIVEAVSGRI